MDAQSIINGVFGLVCFLGGWVLKFMHGSLRDLRYDVASLTDKVQNIEVLVAGQYVKREDMNDLARALFAKLDRIEEKLDGKADKS